MFEIFAKSLTGFREKNDDRALVGKSVINTEDDFYTKMIPPFTVAVFDGVGGCAHGDIAAEIAANTFAESEPGSEADIGKAVICAQYRILAKQSEGQAYSGMSTTVTGLVMKADRAIMFNTGDSSVLLYRAPYLSRLNAEHTVASINKALHLPVTLSDENTLTRSLGSRYYEPDIREFKILSDDIYIICSDGIAKYISDTEIENALHDAPLQDIGRKLICKALNNGSKDNLTLIIIRRTK